MLKSVVVVETVRWFIEFREANFVVLEQRPKNMNKFLVSTASLSSSRFITPNASFNIKKFHNDIKSQVYIPNVIESTVRLLFKFKFVNFCFN